MHQQPVFDQSIKLASFTSVIQRSISFSSGWQCAPVSIDPVFPIRLKFELGALASSPGLLVLID